mgnify:CR=1 FL=1
MMRGIYGKSLSLYDVGVILNFNGNFKSRKDLMALLLKVSLKGLFEWPYAYP